MTDDSTTRRPARAARPSGTSAPPPARKRRRWPLVLGLVLVVLIGQQIASVLVLASRAKGTLDSCRPAEGQFRGSIPFEFPNEVIVIRVRVDGDSVARDFLLDTGAPTMLSRSFLDRVRPRHRVTKITGMRGAEAIAKEGLLRLHGIEIGGVRFRDVGALVLDDARMGAFNCLSPNGVIGYNVLKTGAWQIDYPARTIRFADRLARLGVAGESGRVAYTTRAQETPILAARLDGALALHLTLDTGHNGGITIGRPELASSVGATHPERIATRSRRPAITSRGAQPAAASVTDHVYRATRFEVGGRRFDDCLVVLSDDRRKGTDGLIGNRFLKHFVLTLNYPRREIFLRASAPVVLPGNRLGYGLECAPTPDGVAVSAVYAGSAAERLGVAVGDRVLAVNEMQVSTLTPDDLCRITRGQRTLLGDRDSVVLDLLRLRDGGERRVTVRRAPLFPGAEMPAVAQ